MSRQLTLLGRGSDLGWAPILRNLYFGVAYYFVRFRNYLQLITKLDTYATLRVRYIKDTYHTRHSVPSKKTRCVAKPSSNPAGLCCNLASVNIMKRAAKVRFGTNSCSKLRLVRVYWNKIHQILIRCRGVIAIVYAPVGVANLRSSHPL